MTRNPRANDGEVVFDIQTSFCLASSLLITHPAATPDNAGPGPVTDQIADIERVSSLPKAVLTAPKKRASLPWKPLPPRSLIADHCSLLAPRTLDYLHSLADISQPCFVVKLPDTGHGLAAVAV